MRTAASLLFLIALTGCSAPDSQNPSISEESAAPQRIVSLDYCADQYVLAFADRENILALSTEATDDFSFMSDQAEGIPQVLPRTEDVLALKPDLIVRSFGGGPRASELFRRAGIEVVQIGWGNDLKGIRQVTLDVAMAMSAEERGKELIADFDARLAGLKPHNNDKTALYMTPGGVTSGPGSVIGDMFSAAGFENYETTPGWRDLPLERFLTETPDVVAAAFYESIHKTPGNWSASRHPVALKQLDNADVIPLNGAWTACGGWYLIEAIEALADAHGDRNKN
tara:strand:- start:3967 stop:4815 length:849 start_codon:yes stop_codon:yes gene_type:complete